MNMRNMILGMVLVTMFGDRAKAGDLNVAGNVSVSGSLTAQAISLDGQARSSWPASGLPLQGYKYVVVAEGTDDVQRGANLRASYSTAKTLGPTATQRVAVIVPPGDYDLGTSGLVMDTGYVDLIGLVPAQMTAKQMFTDSTGRKRTKTVGNVQCAARITSGTLTQTVGEVRIESIILQGYHPTVSSANTVLRHVSMSSMRTGVEYAGQYVDCVSVSSYSFGAYSGNASGAFVDCVGGYGSFGLYSIASGTFINCVAGDYGFGGSGTASGTFVGCAAGDWSFGNNVASGTFVDCVADDYSFGTAYSGSVASGTFIDCVAGLAGFGGGYGSVASGTFTRCVGGDYSFGAYYSTLATSAKLQHCKAGTGGFYGFGASEDFNHNPDGASTVFDNDVEIEGKLTLYGTPDPPCLLLDAETRDSIANRVAREVPPSKQTGAALFWDAQTKQLEAYVASEGAYYDLTGKLLASIKAPVVPDATVTRSYRIDPTTGAVVLRERMQAPRWQVKAGYRFDAATGTFTQLGGDTNAPPVIVSAQEALELK
jgi:hypothetical protein